MEIENLISECTEYDFKMMLEEKKPKSWLKNVSAFANGLGGSLFFGVDNDGVIKGLRWGDVEKLFKTLQEPRSMSELKDLYGWTNTTKFKSKYINPLITEQLIALTLPKSKILPLMRQKSRAQVVQKIK